MSLLTFRCQVSHQSPAYDNHTTRSKSTATYFRVVPLGLLTGSLAFLVSSHHHKPRAFPLVRQRKHDHDDNDAIWYETQKAKRTRLVNKGGCCAVSLYLRRPHSAVANTHGLGAICPYSACSEHHWNCKILRRCARLVRIEQLKS